jgi:hypothetical protein
MQSPWNKGGAGVVLRVPPKGDPVWKELHGLQEKAAGGPVPYKEELKFWEAPAASQVYKAEIGGRSENDKWFLPGGKPQQFCDRVQMQLLKQRGFICERKTVEFSDFHPEVGTIVPKDQPHRIVIPAVV